MRCGRKRGRRQKLFLQTGGSSLWHTGGGGIELGFFFKLGVKRFFVGGAFSFFLISLKWWVSHVRASHPPEGFLFCYFSIF